MVLSAHPDDAEFGTAGTVARWTDEGKVIVYVICTNGDKGTRDRSLSPKQISTIRKKEQKAAADILGVREVLFLGYPDQGLEDTPEFRKQIVKLIRTYRPKTLVTSDPYRRYLWHRDHRIIGQVAMDAVFPYARDHLSYPDLLEAGLEPHKVEEILFWGADDIIDLGRLGRLRMEIQDSDGAGVHVGDVAMLIDNNDTRVHGFHGGLELFAGKAPG